MENHFYHIMWPSLNVTIFIMHMRNCVMGATPMLKWAYTKYGYRYWRRPKLDCYPPPPPPPPSAVDTSAVTIIGGFAHMQSVQKHHGLAQIKSIFISYLSTYLHCCTLPDKSCLSHGMCLYQVMMTLFFLNDVANNTELTQKLTLCHNR